jgi:hypothetical protein
MRENAKGMRSGRYHSTVHQMRPACVEKVESGTGRVFVRGVPIMTKKQIATELDAYSIILHASQNGIPLDEYIDKVRDYANKRIRMLQVKV